VIGGIYAAYSPQPRALASARRRAGVRAGAPARHLKVFVEVLIESVRTTSMLFMIPDRRADLRELINYTRCLRTEGLRPQSRCTHLVIVAICAVYCAGTAIEELSMISSPSRLPVVTALGFTPICRHHHRDRRAVGLISPPGDETSSS